MPGRFGSKAVRKAQWEAIADTTELTAELAGWDAVTLETSNLEYSIGPAESRMDGNEHVDEDENFDVDDIPIRNSDLTRDMAKKSIRIMELCTLYADELDEMSSEEEKFHFIEQKWASEQAEYGNI